MIRQKTQIAVIISVMLLALFVLMPYVHNHKADFHVHDDCPSQILAALFSSILIIGAFYLFSVPFVIKFFETVSLPYAIEIQTFNARSPPFGLC